MSFELYLAFLAACVVLAVTPGPNMALFLANGTAHGTKAALMTVGGSTTGLAILVAAATLGMSSIMAFVAEWFDIIRWIGAAYLIWLGVSRLRAVMQSQGVQPAALPIRRGRWFLQGVVASLSNPKVLLFLGAFFPQFIDLSAAVAPQLALLAVSFVVTLAMVDCVVVIAFGSAKGRLAGGRLRFAEGVSGVLLVVGGLWLATARRA